MTRNIAASVRARLVQWKAFLKKNGLPETDFGDLIARVRRVLMTAARRTSG